jgi:hypothetical protein
MVTGVSPEEHGIRDFVIENGRERLPLTSGVRRRPALWNMLDRTGRRGAFLGLWATWPAEETAGIIVSDRARYRQVKNAVYPPSAAPRLARWRRGAEAPGNPFPSERKYAVGDWLIHQAAKELVHGGEYDLVFTYFKSVDTVSHHSWHLFERASAASAADPSQESASSNPVRDAYRAIDTVIAELHADAPAGLNTIVVSDHGFTASREGQRRIHLELDPILEALGFLRWTAEGPIDLERSLAWAFESPAYSHRKRIQARPGFGEGERTALVQRLRRELSTCAFVAGGPIFALKEPKAEDPSRGVVLEAHVVAANATTKVACGGKEVRGAVSGVVKQVTGAHNPNTPGILIASGPMFARGASPAGLSIDDVAPTILYALGLPVARDFVGAPALDLFTPEFRRHQPVRRIDSWGRRDATGGVASSLDQELVDDLTALGYLN